MFLTNTREYSLFAFAKIERIIYFSKIGFDDSCLLCLLGSQLFLMGSVLGSCTDYRVVLWASFLGVD